MTQSQNTYGLFPNLNNIRQRYAWVEHLAVEYMADPLNEWKAEDFARAVHILAEWVFDEHNSHGHGSRQTWIEEIYLRCPSLKAFRDFSNRAKHGGKLNENRQPYFETATSHQGDYAWEDYAREDYDVDRLVLVLPDGTQLDYEDIVQAAVDFWQGVFESTSVPIS